LANYNIQIKKIKESDSKNYIKFDYKQNQIELKLVDRSDETVSLVTKWRKKYRNMFLTDFAITEKNTKKWIENIISNDDRILHVIYFNGEKVGTIGTAKYEPTQNCAQLDSLMKNPTCHVPWLISVVEIIYLKWMFEYFNLSMIKGILFLDNFPTLNLHLSCGFKIVKKIPVEKMKIDSRYIWKENKKNNGKKPERYLIEINLIKKDLSNLQEIE
jgi:RimJ/RimL family protein N-acetyltransferase